MSTIPPWSFSQLESFATCPKKFYHTRVAKDFVEPPSVHTEWGKTVHSAFEDYIKEAKPLPDTLNKWSYFLERIKNLPGDKYTEWQYSLTKSFQPCNWEVAWSRGVADVLVVGDNKAAVIDYKTGKFKPSDQLKLYAAYTFAYYPHIQEVQTAFVWLKDQRITKEIVPRAEVPGIWQSMLERVNKLESAYERDSWPARPSGLCNGWCPVTTCTHNKKKG